GNFMKNRPSQKWPASGNVSPAGQKIVAGQCQAPLPARNALLRIERNHESQGLDEMRSIQEQSMPFVECLVNQTEVAMFQIAQSAVNQLGGGTRCSRSEVSLVHQGHAPPLQSGIEGHSGAGNSSANNQQIKDFSLQSWRIPFHSLPMLLR